MADLILFGTAGCHLCEDAEELLVEAGIGFERAEIMDRPEWQERYGLKIPVLLHAESGRELNWPFENRQLLVFLLRSVTSLRYSA